MISEPVAERPDPWGIIEAGGRSRLSILRLHHPQAAYYTDTHIALRFRGRVDAEKGAQCQHGQNDAEDAEGVGGRIAQGGQVRAFDRESWV